MTSTDPDRLLLPAEVARMFRVEVTAVRRWANTGRISAIKTLGGHRRFRESEVLALLGDDSHRPAPPAVKADDASVHRALGLDLTDTDEL